MIRFITFLLGRQYEPCKSCEILKQQLEFVNAEKKELRETLLAIVKPQPQIVQAVSSSQQIQIPAVSTFSRRRSILESRDRETARTLKDSSLIAKSDDVVKQINNLEKELGVENETEEKERIR